jgi:hypothetical protein
MHKLVAVWGIVILLCYAGLAGAEGPLLQRGTQELAVSGTYDVQRDSRAFLELTGRYGFFLRDHLEVGGFAELSGNFDTFFRFGVGGFAEGHVPAFAILDGRGIPYLGADLGLSFVDNDLGDDNTALVFRPRVGLKWFIRDYFALDTNLFVAVATDDLFPNRRNRLDPYDVGFNFGIRVYFR